MENDQISKFSPVCKLFQCPICGSKMHPIRSSLKCRKGHCFDISSKGYVNFLPNQKQSKDYDQLFFENRRIILDAGFYSHILEGLASHLSTAKQPFRLADVGCGEGYYAKSLARQFQCEVLAFDFSKDAVQIAAKGKNEVLWMVADLAKIPVADHSIDFLLNAFTPANYGEFYRILKPGGTLLKIIPGTNHLRELRSAAKDQIRSEEYSNQQVVDYFEQHFIIWDRQTFSKTTSVDSSQLDALLHMTPLLFGVDKSDIDCSSIKEITIEAELLVGKSG